MSWFNVTRVRFVWPRLRCSSRSSDAAATMPALMEWAAQSGVRLTHLEVKPANLEDVFLSLTGRALRD